MNPGDWLPGVRGQGARVALSALGRLAGGAARTAIDQGVLHSLFGVVARQYKRTLRTVALAALASFVIVELVTMATGVELVRHLTGSWPRVETWLGLAGIATAAATAADHVVAAFVLRRTVRNLPASMLRVLFMQVSMPGVMDLLRRLAGGPDRPAA
jgi:hypothetical protein